MDIQAYSKLTPAEILLIRNKRYVSYIGMLEITFIDLLIRGVIEIVTENSKINSSDARTISLVQRGRNWGNESPKIHETYFLKPFLRNPNSRLLISPYSTTVIDSIKNKFEYLLEMDKSRHPEEIFNQSLFYKIFSPFQLSGTGINLKNLLQEEEKFLKKQLMSKEINEKKLELLILIKSNFLLIKGFDKLHLIEKILNTTFKGNLSEEQKYMLTSLEHFRNYYSIIKSTFQKHSHIDNLNDGYSSKSDYV